MCLILLWGDFKPRQTCGCTNSGMKERYFDEGTCKWGEWSECSEKEENCSEECVASRESLSWEPTQDTCDGDVTSMYTCPSSLREKVECIDIYEQPSGSNTSSCSGDMYGGGVLPRY